MKIVPVVVLLVVLGLTEGRYSNPCDALCDVTSSGSFPVCMSDGSVVCGWCAAKELMCQSSGAVTKVLGEDNQASTCGDGWESLADC